MKKIFCVLLSIIFLVSLVSSVEAYIASSSNYRLEKDSLNFGGVDISTSTNYQGGGTLGEIVSGLASSSNYNASSGYNYMNLDPVVVTPPVVLGCTDSHACNYESSATQDNESCEYTSCISQPPQRLGCMDKIADNYNKDATVDDKSCLYAPNVSDFQVSYDKTRQAVHLTWKNPAGYGYFKKVVVVRGKTPPVNLTNGIVVYEGTGQGSWDGNVDGGVLYYYSVFVVSTKGNHSGGAISSVSVPLIKDEDIFGCLDSSADNYNPQATKSDDSCLFKGIPGPDLGSGVGVVKSPFSYLPIASTTRTTPRPSWTLRFSQPAEKIKSFDLFGWVRLSGQKFTTVLLRTNNDLSFLKTIGLTITDPTERKTYSFLMSRSADGLGYQTEFAPLLKSGTYPLDIYIINYDDQTTSHLSGKIIISNQNIFTAETIINQAAPIAVATGLAVSFLPSLYDLLLVLSRFLGSLFGRRRYDKPWGTVYDSETKQPLDPVYVTAETVSPDGKMKEVASAITDIDGRFSFFLTAGTYYLSANKTHYKFPSEKLKEKTTDEIYNDLYFGKPIIVSDQEIININIPMDAIDFDWNEFAKTKTNFFLFYSQRGLWLGRLSKFFFAFGFAVSGLVLILAPSIFNLIIISLYFGLALFNKLWREKHKPLRVIRAKSKEPLPFAIVRVFLPNLNQQIKQVVADKFGRFYLLVRPGVYYYTVEEKQPDGSYLKVYQSEPVDFKNGILTSDISVK